MSNTYLDYQSLSDLCEHGHFHLILRSGFTQAVSPSSREVTLAILSAQQCGRFLPMSILQQPVERCKASK